ncbi:MAG TPA: hypothetical protein VLC72_03230, partial [Nitrosopumilaceae archaeon]|nr:hypothetical protein [Nitrosopumilaceae archaeon]
ITYIVETTRREHKDGSIDFPKYQVCKTKVKYLMQKLSTYDFDMHSFVTRNFDKEKVQNRNISHIRDVVSRRVTT